MKKFLRFKKPYMLLFCCIGFLGIHIQGHAQLTLPTGTTYTETFDGIGTALPTGWAVRTPASASAAGAAAPFAFGAITWADSGGKFKNLASADGLTSASNTAAQSGSTDRALGVKQSGSFGDPGAAFELTIAETTNRSNFSLQLKHQMLDVQARSAIWTVQYTTVLDGNSGWTTVGTTYTDPGAWGSTTKTYSFGSALNNKSAAIRIRIVTLAATSGSGSRDAYGIDDFVLTWEVPNNAPVASNVTVSGDYTVGETLTGAYSYTDADSDAEGTSTFKWYRSNSSAGSGEAAISGATSSTYVLTSADANKYIRLGVTPVATAGTLTGTESFSTRQLALAPAIPALDVSSNSLTFGNTSLPNSSTAQSFNLSGSLLTGAPGVITITAPNTDFEVSNDSSAWGPTTTIAYTSATLASTPVYVRFSPQTTGAKSGNITISGGGVAVTPTVAVTGTGILSAPVAQSATLINDVEFTANWDAVTGATGYLLDVSTTPDFVPAGTLLTEGFESTTFPPTGWSATGWTRSTTSADISTGIGAAYAGSNNGTLVTAAVSHPTSMTFNLGRSTNTTAKTLTIEVSTTSQTTGFATVFTYDHSNVTSNTYTSYTVDLSAYAAAPTVYIRFNKTSATTAPWRLDNIVISKSGSDILTGYDGKVISGQSTVTDVVTGLNQNTNYYYRVRATNGTTTSANSNTINTKTTTVSTTWNGSQWSNSTPISTIDAIIEGVYNTTTNGVFTAKSLTLNNGTFTVASGTNITVVTDVVNTLTSDKFIIENNANLIQNGTVNNNTGNITVQRNANMRQLDYVYWSAPVATQNLQSFSPSTLVGRFYTIDEQTNSFLSAGAATNSFSLAKGYVIRAPNNFLPAPASPQLFTGSFAGKPNNGDITIPLTVLGEGYNLIGNPYPSTVNADLFLADAANQNIETLYFWTHMTTTAGGVNYATYNSTGAAGATPSATTPVSATPNGFIQTGQGFIAKTSIAGNATFKNSMRAGNNADQFFRTANTIEKNRIWLTISDANTTFNQALIGYITDATDALDTKFDGKLIETSGTRLYNLINNSEYVIQGKAVPFMPTDIVTLGFKAATAGTFTISIDHVDGLFSNSQDIFLKDNLNNTLHNLKQSAYNFASEQGTFNNRFEIVYQNTTLGIENPTLNAESIVVYKQNNTLNINAGTTIVSDVKIFDIRGRLLFEQNGINATTIAINNLKADQQVLVVQITSADNKTVSKKVVY